MRSNSENFYHVKFQSCCLIDELEIAIDSLKESEYSEGAG
jgi:hypothetical protein